MYERRGFAPLDLSQLIAITLIWGVNNILAKLTLMVLPPLTTIAIRFTIVLIALAVFIRPLPKGYRRASLAALLLVGPLHFGIQFTGLSLAHDLAPMVVVMQLWIPLSVLFASLILGERLGAMRASGIAVAFAGIGAMSFDPVVLAQGSALILIVIAAACYALGAVLVRRMGAAMDPWSMQGWTAIVTTPLMLLGSSLVEHGQIAAIAAAPWWIWAFLGFGALVSSIVANAFLFRLVQRYEVSRITPYMLVTPLISFVLAAFILHDTITWRIALGSAVTLSGVALVALSERRLKPA